MRTFCQRRIRGELPATVITDDDFADDHAVVDDGDFVARGETTATEGRGTVVSHAAVANVAGDRTDVVDGFFNATRSDTRLNGCDGIDSDDVRIRRQADVTGSVNRYGGEAVLSVCKGWRRGKCPGAIRIDEGFADFDAVGENIEPGTRFTRTAKGRGVVISETVWRDHTLLVAHVIADRIDHGLARSSDVDDEIEFVGGLADVAVLVLLLNDNRMLAARQRRGRGVGPLAIIANDDFADRLAIVRDDDGIARSAGTVERRCGVVG